MNGMAVDKCKAKVADIGYHMVYTTGIFQTPYL